MCVLNSDSTGLTYNHHNTPEVMFVLTNHVSSLI